MTPDDEPPRDRKAWKAEEHALEQRLPPAYRGRRGYRHLLDSVSIRISVSGVRGKSGLTKLTAQALQERGLSTYSKVTGTDPVSYKDDRSRPIRRDPRRKAILEETVWEVKRFWPMDAVVLENQAITPYTMVTFNELFCRPNYLFITNIRRDHGGDLARNLPGMARAFALSAPRGTTIISGERKSRLKAILAKKAKERECRFIDASPRSREVPGMESIHILDAMLKDWVGQGLTRQEYATHRARLEDHFRWLPSSIPGVPWFHGAEINDVDSTQEVLDHLLRQRNIPVNLVAYTRRDRADRTVSFIPYLEGLLEESIASRVIVAGCHAKRMARHLKKFGEVWVAKDDPERTHEILDILHHKAQGEAIFTIMNAVPPWPKAMATALAGDTQNAPRPTVGMRTQRTPTSAAHPRSGRTERPVRRAPSRVPGASPLPVRTAAHQPAP